jgi:DNA-binding LacI/PurR family transcriptional regulator
MDPVTTPPATATIQDVARAAAVSPATVSRVLNRPEIVATDKVERVRAAIEALGYRPSASARELRTGMSRTIGLLVGDISQPFHGALAKSVEQAAETHGYGVMLGDLDHREDRLLQFLAAAPSRGLAGLVIATADDLDKPRLRDAVRAVRAAGVAVVTTSQTLAAGGVPTVSFDYRQMGRDAADHLLRAGCRRLVVLGGGAGSWFSRAVEAGVRAATRAAGAGVQVVNGRFQSERARLGLARALGRGPAPDGVVAANTPMAVGAIRALADAGLRVPADVAVVVCEDVPDAQYLSPSLSVIETDLGAYGRVAVDMLLKVISDSTFDDTAVLPHSLVARESSSRDGATDGGGRGD